MLIDDITLYYKICLYIGFPLGIILMILRAKYIYPVLLKKLQQQKTINKTVVARWTFFMMLPGVLGMIICVIPLFYFHNLLKKESYCATIIEVNNITDKNDEFLQVRCKGLNIEELLNTYIS